MFLLEGCCLLYNQNTNELSSVENQFLYFDIWKLSFWFWLSFLRADEFELSCVHMVSKFKIGAIRQFESEVSVIGDYKQGFGKLPRESITKASTYEFPSFSREHFV